MEDGKDGANIAPVGDNKNVSIKNGTKRKRSGISLLRAALHMLHRRPSAKKSKKPIYAEVASAEVLNKVVGSMRPLHAQSNESPPHAVAPVIVVSSFPSPPEQFEDVPQSPGAVIVPPSPDHSSTASDGGTSRYASALNLQDLDTIDDDEDENEENGEDEGAGDEMIDLKADEFIARFYQQMRIQNKNEMDRLRNKHHHRLQPAHVGDASRMR